MKKQLLIITLLLTTFFTFGQVPISERDALIALYNLTNGENWTNNTNWNTAEPVSGWFGVVVENIQGQDHVKELNLQNNNLVGQIPNGLDAFSEITLLILKGNQLSGTIPNSICNLTSLEYLHLGFNSSLDNGIPPNIGNLSNLNYISFYGNDFTNEIPDSFFNLTDISVISMGDNQFSNEIFDVSSFTSLTILRVNGSLFTKIDMRNGNNTDISEADFTSCPNLTCIFVDDAAYSTENWTYIDATSTFVENQEECNLLGGSDESLKENIVLYPIPTSGILHIKNTDNIAIEKITILNTLGQKIIDSKEVIDIDISNWINGIYYVNIENSKGFKTAYKIIKE